MSHPPGWYATGTGDPGELRRWDGTAWTPDFDPPRPFTEADLDTPPPGSPGPAHNSPTTDDTRGWTELPPASALPPSPHDEAQWTPPLPTPPRKPGLVRRWGGLLLGAAGATALWAGLGWFSDGGAGVPPASARAMLDVSTTVPADVTGPDLSDAEEFVATLPRTRDDEGSYVTTAATMADALDAELRWHEYGSHGLCTTGDTTDAEFVLAAYCSLDPGSVLLNSSNASYPDFLYFEAFVDVVAHELAHKVIDRRCGTTDPGMEGAHFEGITNSYAVAYLGADAQNLTATMTGFDDYAMTAETDAAAQRIHEGDCN